MAEREPTGISGHRLLVQTQGLTHTTGVRGTACFSNRLVKYSFKLTAYSPSTQFPNDKQNWIVTQHILSAEREQLYQNGNGWSQSYQITHSTSAGA